jgi:protease-4
MKDFLKSVFASALGFSLTLLTGFLLMIVFIAVIATHDPSEGVRRTHIQSGTFLVIGNGMAVNDTPEHGSPGIGTLLSGGNDMPQVDLYRALEAIDLAAKDPNVAGILIVEGLDAGLATKSELRKALEGFIQSSKKPVIAWMENPSTGQYHMMTAAKTLILHKSGEVQFAGIASYSTYWGEGLRRLGVGVQVTKVGKYKSAVEPLIGDKMSEAARQQSQELLDDVWNRLMADVSRARGIPVAQLQKAASNPGIFSPQRALELKLVDKVMQRDELIAEVIRAGATDDSEGSFRQVSLARYAGKVKLPKGSEQVAVVYAEGDIVDGMGSPTSVGGDRVAATLRHLRNDEKVKAVVLRVNSPGGSAFASEIIHRELELLRKKGVPIIVSMGDLAASGGYYIAAPGTTVIADPMTITGSIGVFGLHFNYGELAAKLSLATDGVKTATHADLLSVHRPATVDELTIVQESVDRIYEQFLGVVGSGRKMKRDDVHEIAQGRVWSGSRARKLGLVDSFGGLRDAIAEASKQANLKEPGIVQFPGLHEDRRSLAEMVLSDDEESPLFTRTATDPVMQLIRSQWQQAEAMRNLNDRRGIYLLAPLRIDDR